MDPTIAVAIVTAIGFVISSSIAGLITYATNRREPKSAAEEAAEEATSRAVEEKEEVLLQRIALREDQILGLERKVKRQADDIAKLKMQLEKVRGLLREEGVGYERDGS
jgi:TolA-binding protein